MRIKLLRKKEYDMYGEQKVLRQGYIFLREKLKDREEYY